GADRVRSKIPDQPGQAIYLEAATKRACLRRLILNGDEFFDKLVDFSFLELSVGEIDEPDDNRSWRPCCFLIGAYHVWSGRLSGWEELRFRGAAVGDQAISTKIYIADLFFNDIE
ncbi:MAG: hypothetical protein WBH40_02620, partial [Ignavibacteriaceae bacterium]